MPLLIDSRSIGLRSVIDSSLSSLVTFVFVVVLSALESDKGGKGGGGGMFELIFEGAEEGKGGGGGGGRVGVIVGGGGLDGKVLCADGVLDTALRGALGGKLDNGTLGNAEDVLKRLGGKGGAVRV